jgi:membrane protein implicated in regulation of membrane protease activity
MKAVFTALVVSLVFAVFFVAFLVVPALVIAVAYFGMTWHHKRLSRRAKAARNDEGDGGGEQAQIGGPPAPDAPHRVDTTKPPLVGSPTA